jgi:hypothetical protein
LKQSFLRALILAVIAATMLLDAHGVLAAPTCQDRNGDTIRCGTQGAMPVGWTLPPAERLEKERLHPPIYPSANTLLEIICALGVFFALLALMPDFEGDWDKQEGDDKKAR